MQIKSLIQGCAVAGILVGPIAWHGPLRAGEAIQFSNDKTRPVPASENPLTKDRVTAKNKLSGNTPLDVTDIGLVGNNSRRRLDSKEQRRLDNKKLEDENWMILNEGDLQAQDDYDEVYGRSDFDSDKKRTSGDIWFAARPGENGREVGMTRSSTGALRPSGQNRPPEGSAPDEDKDTSFSFARRLGRAPDAKSDPGAKASGNQSSPGANTTDSALKDLFGPGDSPGRGTDDRSRSDLGFRSFDKSGERASSLGNSFGIGQSTIGGLSMKDSALKPAAPAASSSSLSPPSLGRFGDSTRFDSFSPRPNSWTAPTPPLQPQSPADSSPRSTRGTFDIPSRPGFGR